MRIFNVMAVAAAGMLALVSCQNNDCKFNAKEYAERKTDKIDQIVELDDAQEKAVYAIYLEEGKQIKENIKAWEKQKGEMKHPDCKGPKAECDKKANCKKAECDKAACDKKAECKKAECSKAECGKAECGKATCDKKADCKKAECDKAACDKKADCKKADCDKAACDKKADCKKAECNKATCDKKAECKKAECDKATCDKKAECKKAECTKKADCKKAECGQPTPPRHHRHMISPKVRKETFQKIDALLTPEQQAKLKEHFAQRKACAPKAEQCCPTQTKCKQNK